MLLFKDKRYERFFSPLCSSRNKELYYDCIKLLIEKSQEVPELYEEDARKFLRSYIENLGYDFQDDTGIEMKADLLSNSRSDADNANTIIRYFRKCGWIADPEIGRNGEGILIITPYCISLIKALEQNFGEDVNATMTNHILDMHGIFKDMFTAGHARALNPYSTALAPLADRAFGLKMELLKLKDNIRDISKEIMTLTETNQLGQFQLKNELLDRFFHDYFNLKNDGMIDPYISQIESYISKLRQKKYKDLYDSIIQEYMSLKKCDCEIAAEEIEKILKSIEACILYDYPDGMERIEDKITKYYDLYKARIGMIMSDRGNLLENISILLTELQKMDPNERDTSLSKLKEMFWMNTFKYVGPKSLIIPKRRKSGLKVGSIMQDEISEEERNEIIKSVGPDYEEENRIKKVNSFLQYHSHGSSQYIPDKESIRTEEDLDLLISSIIYAGGKEVPYDVSPDSDSTDNNERKTEETPAATFTKIKFEKKQED